MDPRTACYSRLMFVSLTSNRSPGTLHELPGLDRFNRRRMWKVKKSPGELYDYLLVRWEREGLRHYP